jgi:hypothetical protein
MLYTEVENVASKSSDVEVFDCWPEQEFFVLQKVQSIAVTHTVSVHEWVPKAFLGCDVDRE